MTGQSWSCINSPLATYTIRRKNIDWNYEPDTFTASAFAEIKKELSRPGNPWLNRWSVHTDEEKCLFDKQDWLEALAYAGCKSKITLRLLRECRAAMA